MTHPSSRRCFACLPIVIALISMILGCAGGEESVERGKPNLLLITLDTTRRDHLGCYGQEGGITPNLDALAFDGVRFDMAISTSAMTPAAHASILTGLNPQQHGVRVIYAQEGYRLSESIPTLGTLLQERSWQTAAFLSSFTVSSFYGFDRGFDTLDEGLNVSAEESFAKRPNGFYAWPVGENQRRSDATTDRFLSWIQGVDGPFFAWVHYWDPHDPQVVPPNEVMQSFVSPGQDRQTTLRSVYLAEVHFMDTQIGRVVRALKEKGLYDNTVIVVVADHGEGLGDHDWWYHRILYQEQIQVPLIVRAPGWPGGDTVEDLVRIIDIAPTVLELLGVEIPTEMAGVSLGRIVRGESGEPLVAYADAINLFDLNAAMVTRRPDDALVYCTTDGTWKLLHRPLLDGKDELYNLASDPREQVNLIDTEPAQAERLKAELDHFDGYVDRGFGEATDPETLERLRSLGYVGN